MKEKVLSLTTEQIRADIKKNLEARKQTILRIQEDYQFEGQCRKNKFYCNGFLAFCFHDRFSKNSRSVLLNSCGRSTGVAWRESGMMTSCAPGIFAVYASFTETGE